MDTKDSLTKHSPAIKPTKLKKGYLAYDNECHGYFRSRFQLPPLEVKFPEGMPKITAKDFCIIDSYSLQSVHLHKSNNNPIEIASLTKVVTCLLTILACKKYEVDIAQYKCRISDDAAMTIGTSAELQSGDMLTIEELLFALMLPSGNDAAVALAENVGKIIQRKKKMGNNLNPVCTFVRHMNVIYKELIDEEEQK